MNRERHIVKAICAMAGCSERSKRINAWEDRVTLGGPRVRGKKKPRGFHPEDQVTDWGRLVGPGVPQRWKPNG